MRRLDVLNLGGGKQSTRLYLGFASGEFEPELDAAIFADTGEEEDATYRNVEWLQKQPGPPILVVRHPDTTLGDSLAAGMNGHGGRFVTIPAFTTVREGDTKNKGITRRQCTKEFKTLMIERGIRRNLLGLALRQALPKDVEVHQYFGISWDERARAMDIEQRITTRMVPGKGGELQRGLFDEEVALEDLEDDAGDWEGPHRVRVRGYFAHFPLIDPARRVTRQDCEDYNQAHVPHEVVKSACVFCPFHSDAEWERLRHVPAAWSRIVQIDRALRTVGTATNRGLDQPMYLHAACRPIDEIAFDRDRESFGFMMECSGACGV